MEITFTKISDDEHAVRVKRPDDSVEEAVLVSRGYLQHDFAHLAVELEVPLARGYWGSVAAGAALDGMSIRSPEIGIAESLAGPMQGLVRDCKGINAYKAVLDRMQPALSSSELAERIHERVRVLLGRWRATPRGSEMVVQWPEPVAK